MNIMIRHSVIRIVFFLFIGVGLLTIIPSSLAGAEGSSQPPQDLTISPLRQEVTIAPGTVQTGQLIIVNSSPSTMAVHMTAEAFSVINQRYDYSFDSTSSIVKWVRFDTPDFTLTSRTSKVVGYSINVPLTAQPGGTYISLFATTSIGVGGTAVRSSVRVGSLLYITVSGTVSRTGYLLGLFTPLLMTGNTTWNATLRNSGTAQFTGTYTMRIRTLWNADVSSTTNSSLILPSTIRLIEGQLYDPTIPGVYKLIFTTSLGDTPDVTTVRYVVYMPIWGWIIIAVIVLFGISKLIRVFRLLYKKLVKSRRSR